MIFYEIKITIYTLNKYCLFYINLNISRTINEIEYK